MKGSFSWDGACTPPHTWGPSVNIFRERVRDSTLSLSDEDFRIVLLLFTEGSVAYFAQRIFKAAFMKHH